LRAPLVSPAIMTKITLLQNSRINENRALSVARRFNKLVCASQERSSLSLVLANQNQGKKNIGNKFSISSVQFDAFSFKKLYLEKVMYLELHIRLVSSTFCALEAVT